MKRARLAVYPPEYILSIVRACDGHSLRRFVMLPYSVVRLDGSHESGTVRVHIKSHRLRLFARSAFLGCACCGTPGHYFALELQSGDQQMPHLDLYARRSGGECLMTADHIVPRCRGGTNAPKNLQILCHSCNQAKGNKLMHIDKLRDLKKVPVEVRRRLDALLPVQPMPVGKKEFVQKTKKIKKPFGRLLTLPAEAFAPMLKGREFEMEVPGLGKYKVPAASQRLTLFGNRQSCELCGLEGHYFTVEVDTNQGTSVQLYGVRDGKEIVMMPDRIVPIKKGGTYEFSNLRLLCDTCKNRNDKAERIAVLSATKFVISPQPSGSGALLSGTS